MKQDNKTSPPAEDQGKTNKTGVSMDGRIMANPVVSCRVEGKDGAILFNPDTDSTLLIDPAGIVVWNFISQPRTIDEIVEYITDSYSDSPDPAAVRKDIETFVRDLASGYLSEV
jgi:hypothetical protein